MSAYNIGGSTDLADQNHTDTCFAGGIPHLPQEMALPQCALCQAGQSFFFQIAFPQDHPWPGRSIAVFACTACDYQRHLIPKMVKRPQDQFDIPVDFFEGYETKHLDGYALNFRFLVFNTSSGVPRSDYRERVRFQRWQLYETHRLSAPGNRIGGKPYWLQSAQTPATYHTTIPMVFLLQLEEDLEYEIVPGAPPQIVTGLDGRLEVSDDPFYTLFVGNALYLFGTDDPTERYVYAVTQSRR